MKKATILYFFDPLCLTCYSFRSILDKIRREYAELFKFDMVAGGMVTGNRAGPVSQKADYLKKKIAAIENTTDARFGEKFKKLLDKGEYISDSLPPSIAFNVFKSFRPEQVFELGHAIQDAHYWHGKDLNNIRAYFSICEQFEINKRGFMERFNDPAYEKLTTDLFDYARNENVKQFPSLMQETGKGLHPICVGYKKWEELKLEFKNLLEST